MTAIAETRKTNALDTLEVLEQKKDASFQRMVDRRVGDLFRKSDIARHVRDTVAYFAHDMSPKPDRDIENLPVESLRYRRDIFLTSIATHSEKLNEIPRCYQDEYEGAIYLCTLAASKARKTY